jgi:hypothetical protein
MVCIRDDQLRNLPGRPGLAVFTEEQQQMHLDEDVSLKVVDSRRTLLVPPGSGGPVIHSGILYFPGKMNQPTRFSASYYSAPIITGSGNAQVEGMLFARQGLGYIRLPNVESKRIVAAGDVLIDRSTLTDGGGIKATGSIVIGVLKGGGPKTEIDGREGIYLKQVKDFEGRLTKSNGQVIIGMKIGDVRISELTLYNANPRCIVDFAGIYPTSMTRTEWSRLVGHVEKEFSQDPSYSALSSRIRRLEPPIVHQARPGYGRRR